MKEPFKNYAAQAVESLTRISNLLKPDNKQGANLLRLLIGSIKAAVHFQLPVNGALLNDNLKGMDSVILRLPYTGITFAFDYEAPINRKVLGIAVELSADSLRTHKFFKSVAEELPEEELFIAVMLVSAAKSDDYYWDANPIIVMLPSNVWQLSLEATAKLRAAKEAKGEIFVDARQDANGKKSKFQIIMRALNLYPDLYVEQYSDADECKARIIADTNKVTTIGRVLLELIEALTCSNVTHEPINQISAGHNARRMRKGKTPFYEVRTLVINAAENKEITASGTPTGIRYKQHLCRGHQRVYKTGLKIWINSYLRGDPNLGFIDKNYNVRN